MPKLHKTVIASSLLWLTTNPGNCSTRHTRPGVNERTSLSYPQYYENHQLIKCNTPRVAIGVENTPRDSLREARRTLILQPGDYTWLATKPMRGTGWIMSSCVLEGAGHD